MKRAGLVLGLVLLTVIPATAQAPRFEFAGGYTFMRDQDRSEDFPAGWIASVAGNVNDWIGIVSEVGFSHRTCNDCQRGPFTSETFRGTDRDLRVFTFMAGPRTTWRALSAVTPFAQILLGGAHISGGVQFDGALTTGFSYQPGGGVDLNLRPNLGVRLQGDYRIVRTQGHNTNASRFVVGVVWRQGQLSGGG
jgi:opacity protein-like surface antigen